MFVSLAAPVGGRERLGLIKLQTGQVNSVVKHTIKIYWRQNSEFVCKISELSFPVIFNLKLPHVDVS